MRRLTLSPQAYRRITLAALLALGFIIVTGAAVRLTGSGLGCPTWPTCEEGSLVPRSAENSHAMIEFVNRTVTGLVSVTVMLAVAGSLIRRPRRRDLTTWSLTLVAGVVAQIVLGGLTVLFELAPPFVIGHFLLSIVLVTCATVLHHKAGQPDAGVRRERATPEVVTFARLVVALAAAVVVSGTIVTGSGPHGGDENADRLGFAVRTAAQVHSLAAWALLAATLWTFALVRRGGAATAVETALRWLIGLSVWQGAVGYTQYFTGVPETLVGLHVLGSVLVFVAALHVLLSTSAVEAPEPAVSPPVTV